MSDWSITFAPLFEWHWIALISFAAGLLALYGLWRGVRGAWVRLAAFALMALALCNPSLLQEDREPLKTVVAVVVEDLIRPCPLCSCSTFRRTLQIKKNPFVSCACRSGEDMTHMAVGVKVTQGCRLTVNAQ